jgi:ankyrin repeat protein
MQKMFLLGFLKRRSLTLLALLVSLVQISCNSKESARRKLADLKLDYAPETLTNVISKGDVHATTLFLQAGMDPNVKDTDGKTPLASAAEKGNLEVAKLLLSKGALPSVKTQDEQTALHIAVAKGQTAFAKLLLESGAKTEDTDKNGRPALHTAILTENSETVQLLLGAGSSINTADKDGNSALHIAASTGSIAVLKLILDKAEASALNTKNKNGRTPLDLAQIKSFESGVAELESRGATATVTKEMIDAAQIEKKLVEDAKILMTGKYLRGFISRALDSNEFPDLEQSLVRAGLTPLQLLQVRVGTPAILVMTTKTYSTTGFFSEEALFWDNIRTNLGETPVLLQYPVSKKQEAFYASVGEVSQLLAGHIKKVGARFFRDYPVNSPAGRVPPELSAGLNMARQLGSMSFDDSAGESWFYFMVKRAVLCQASKVKPSLRAAWPNLIAQLVPSSNSDERYWCTEEEYIKTDKTFQSCACDKKDDVVKLSNEDLKLIVEAIAASAPVAPKVPN